MQPWMKKLVCLGAIGLSASIAARVALRRARWFSFEGKTVLITGGSRGLGLVLARQLVDAGATVAICARSETDLQAAEDELRARGGNILAISCDVRDERQVQAMVSAVGRRWGDIDVLLNVAGIIEVGPLDAMTREDFERSMDTHFWGALHTSLAVLPGMRRRGWGRIGNVASLGGLRAVPHMLPYSASKFALVGLSNGLRAELAKDNILVSTICPSLMRTGSPRNAIFKGQHRQEYAWFSVGDALPMASMPVEKAARQILRCVQNGDAETIVASPINLSIAVQTYLPGLTRGLLTLADRLLPSMGGIGSRAARGYESESAWSPSFLTRLSDQAARDNNEMRLRSVD